MNHMNLSDELRAQLIESASWGKAGITPRLDEEVINEKKKKTKDTGASKGDKGKDKDDSEATDYEDGGDRRGDQSKTRKGRRDYENCEEETAHACPLCASELSEAIDEERLLEHLDIVVGLVDRLSQLQEGDEDIDSVIDETIAELLLQNEEE